MSAELNTMLNAQRDIHYRMSRSMDNLRNLCNSGINPGSIEARIRILDQLWAKFETQHELIRITYKERYNESEYATDFFDTAENTYIQQTRGKLAEYAECYQTVLSTSAASNEQQNNDRSLKSALPKIKLSPFSGAYEYWPSFRDLFLSVIGENSAMSPIERFHYLLSGLQGPAEKLIRP
ncbi:uncharacterized protein LOC126852608 [Cataglyphis hispanica]|uniref:uncharacterized protein LOC126852608 n=1 Tax=Cataglyphis hispanica TaxID=1086592 RepID=UPI002180843E|nr:uncharacterized protein LOC126852608 [Cataglyphis hispanica]